jgi:thiamine-monophosphate kinase
MAAVPLAALYAVSLSNRLSMDEALDLFRGARDCGMRFGCPLVGGDTNSWDQPTVISIAVAAQTEAGRRPVLRSGARPDDRIFVTGPLGGSILGRHLSFEPRIQTALDISRQLAPHAMIDISDGLAIDLWRILEASRCGALLEAAALEAAIHPDAVRLSAQDGLAPRDHALHDGEDFELIVCLSADTTTETWQRLGLWPLGWVTTDDRLLLRESDGRCLEIDPHGWEHFR